MSELSFTRHEGRFARLSADCRHGKLLLVENTSGACT